MSRFGASPRLCPPAGGRLGRQLIGGSKESSPQLRSPPRSGLLKYSVLYFGSWYACVFAFVVCAFGVRPRTTPFLVFKIAFVVSLPLRISVLQDYGGAHPLVMDALAEMSEAQMHRAYPSVCEYTHALPTRARTRETPYLNLRRRSIRLFNKASSGMRVFNSFAFSSKSEILVFLLSSFPSKD